MLYIILYCTTLCCVILYYITLCYIISYYITLLAFPVRRAPQELHPAPYRRKERVTAIKIMHTHVYMYIYVYIHICMYIYIYTHLKYIYIYIHNVHMRNLLGWLRLGWLKLKIPYITLN